jgi:hypothetical protein
MADVVELFNQEEEGVDPEEFTSVARDDKGHSDKLQFRVIPNVSRQVSLVVEKKIFPYESKSDLLRHALHRHLNWLHSLSKDMGADDQIRNTRSMIRVLSEIMKVEESNLHFHGFLDTMTKTISDHIAKGAIGHAKKLVLQSLREVEALGESYWKDIFVNRVKENFKGVLEEAEVVSFLGLEE